MIYFWIILFLLFTYLFASIPTGYIVVKVLKGIDIRTVGSGNIGATNVNRVLGIKWFIFVLIFDALKGYLPVFISKILFKDILLVPIFSGIAAILGHTFTVFLNFKGGKGVATSFGVFLALAPISLISSFIIFIIVLFLFKYISLSSIIASILFPAFVFIYGETGYLNIILYFSLLASIFIIYKHKENIKRLLTGNENRFEIKAKKKVK
ncbi:MAG: glycerol-3-phosphate 1-O-acyltransferase PlsY [Candidatus Goldbacteria bacterium]|nr:glycerol-3-phosphate 1-O-acyltransferase PlsY [Candidatus Goldiibacteriota bacterium]